MSVLIVSRSKYGSGTDRKEADRIWEKTVQNYNGYLPDLPDYGEKKNGHARAIYGGRI